MMAESAVPDVSLSAGSEPAFDIVCQPCSSDGKTVEAEVYCRDCHGHLCGQCIKDHKKFATMRHHQLVDKDAMPGTQDICTDRCRDHDGEIIKFFCPDHDDLACRDCVTLYHKTCDMDYIQDVAEDKTHDFISELENEDLSQEPDTIKLAMESKQRSADCHAKVTEDLDAYRDELVDAVDKSIQDMRDYSGHVLANDTERMDKLAALSNQFMAELRSMRDEFIGLRAKKHFCKMFVEMKRKEKTLIELQGNIECLGGADPRVTTYTFQSDEELRTALSRHGGLGKLLLTSCGKINAKHVSDINVESTENDATCAIKGIAMVSQNKVVVADYNNETIKIIDTVTNKIMSQFSPEACPCDIVVCDDTIAATLPSANKIVFVKYDRGLVHDRDINVDGRCKGIDFYDDNLYVVFSVEKKLEVMTTAGVVLQRFTTTDTGEQLFNSPRYVTVSAVNKRIYVTDSEKGHLIVLDMDGKQTGVYQDGGEMTSATQMAVDETGVMFLCDYNHDSIQLLSPDVEKVKILLTDDDGVDDPYSVCYCEETRRLYVGMLSDTVKVYQIS